jgi:septum formation protein
VRSTSTSTPPTWSDLKLVLASRSPQREAILRQLGVPFRVRVSDYDEVLSGDDPASLVVANAVGKARDVERHVRHEPPVLVLGVDTVVVVDGEILGKPADPEAAISSLRRLCGRTHQVFSGLCLTDGAREETGHATTNVTFRALGDETLSRYVACGEWRQRAGGYAIQGVGSALVTGVEGDYWNVVGLPVAVLLGTMERFGLAPLSWV